MHQTLSDTQPDTQRALQLRGIAMLVVVLFALSGLLGGFAYGAITRLRQPQPSPLTIKPPVHPTPSITPVPTPGPRSLGCPTVQTSQSQQNADARTFYTANVQAQERYQDQICNLEGKQQALYDDGLTCRLWLMKGTHNPRHLPDERIRHMQLAAPFPDDAEVAGGLSFDSTTPQTQPCQRGMGNWKYTVSSSVKSGTYYLMGLTVWEGLYYNWSWTKITVKNAQEHKEKDPDRHDTGAQCPAQERQIWAARHRRWSALRCDLPPAPRHPWPCW